MKTSITHEKYGTIEYNESFWLGKKTVTINGEKLTKVSSNNYKLKTENAETDVQVKGNSFLGVTLTINDEKITVYKAIEWYVIALSVLFFTFITIWGNVKQLVMIFPIVSGAIGGGLSAGLCVVGIYLTRLVKKPIYKILICFAYLVATFLLLYLCAIIYLSIAIL